ncbi:MAG: hypothetical protein P8179_24380 [Candidatus Thiodiazotropha sp.]
MKSALVVVQGKTQRRHAPPQACHSRCSVIHPVGDHNHRSNFLQNQIPVIRMERSTDFFRIINPKRPVGQLKGLVWCFIQIDDDSVTLSG